MWSHLHSRETTMNVGIRELKANLSRYLACARAGERVVVTDRGVPVARIEPVQTDQPPVALRSLIDSGRLIYKRRTAEFPRPVTMLPGDKDWTDYVREQRR
jgi:prevent-host-death family protein